MIIAINIRAASILSGIWKWLLFHALFVIAVYYCMLHYQLQISMATIISMIGIVLSILMGFRISSAYDRWWEARKIWGALVNDSRTLIRQLIVFTLETKVTGKHLQSMAYRQIAFLYALGQRLRGQPDFSVIASFLYTDEWDDLVKRENFPNLLLLHNLYAFKKLESEGHITNFDMLRLDETTARLTDSLGGAERIKNTPFPIPYSHFTSFLVHLFAMLLPFGMVETFGYIAIPIAICVIFIFMIIEQIAIEIQDPFSNKENDIPVTAIANALEIDIKEMLGDRVLPFRNKAHDGIIM
ncbi:bestrophin family protein [Mucilaginibacter defluvii]